MQRMKLWWIGAILIFWVLRSQTQITMLGSEISKCQKTMERHILQWNVITVVARRPLQVLSLLTGMMTAWRVSRHIVSTGTLAFYLSVWFPRGTCGPIPVRTRACQFGLRGSWWVSLIPVILDALSCQLLHLHTMNPHVACFPREESILTK